MLDILRSAEEKTCSPEAVALHALSPARVAVPAPAGKYAPYARMIHVDAQFDAGGAWAGVSELADAAYCGLRDRGADAVLRAHLLALHAVLPEHRDHLHPDHLCLTDTAGDAEKTRFHPLNRAYRLVHELVGLMFAWKQAVDEPGKWAVIVWNFDQAQHLGSRFFAELARRSGQTRKIDVIVATRPGWSDAALQPQGLQKIHNWLKHAALISRPQQAHALDENAAFELQSAISNGSATVLEQHHARLIAFYDAVGDGLAAARIALKTLVLYTSLGYYHEARQMLDRFSPYWDQLIGDDEEKCAYHVAKMNICLLMTGDTAGALRVIEDLAAARLTRPHLLANVNYSLGMHYLRYAQAKDLACAEQHLLRAAELNRETDTISGVSRDPFKKVFFDNGLAFLRVRQGRPQEALALCRDGYAYLTGELGEQRHCLHRSVLQYNIANLLVAMGDPDSALEHYAHAISMDPNYSEYHNEVGNIHQEQGRYQEAIAYYEQAIQRSAPYPEVYYNKAICHMRQDEWDEALACFDTTLELNPDQPEACILRADLLRELDRLDEALEGYGAALRLGCRSAALHVNRAVLHYTNGDYDLALADMQQAIILESDEPSHYENRAAIYRAMAREDLSLRDLQYAERCRELA